MKRTVFSKIAAGYMVLIVLLSAALFLFSVRTFKQHSTEMMIDMLRQQAALFRPVMMPLYIQGKYDELDSLVKQTGAAITTRITVIAPDGRVIADTEAAPRSMENHGTRPEVLQALSGSIGSAIRHSATVAEDMLYVAVPIYENERIAAVLRMSLFMHDVTRLIDRFQYGMLWIALCIVCTAMIAAFIISRRITRPIRMLDEAAQAVSAGNMDARVFLDSNDELQECADSFNVMTEKIKTQIQEITLRRQELEHIIEAMHEYLLVIDDDGRIMLTNRRFNEFIGSDDVRGRFYWECIKEPAFGEMVKEVRTTRQGRIAEIALDGRMLLCSMSWIEQYGEIIAVCLDITEIRNVERIKRDFVVNVSHELRTPLTAIKGFIDTILDEEEEPSHRKYLEIIKRHTDRLISIVKDLLMLSQLEEERRLDIEPVELVQLVEQVRKIYEQRLDEKGLFFDLQADPDLGHLFADRFKLEQVFINLIDNAVKYTEHGGITVSIKADGDWALIVVQDTGIGIRQEQLGRIFERFYVVDKARSRQTGGTGLGLSIVKHIIQQHGGTIEAKSQIGQGTSFIMRIPRRSSAG
ncbi:MAG: ATP-binding protein [Desulfobacterota bacterium]|nr:ATP-binding protein [Thermodesulfobacteriota bacterium]